jgi:hypothetical protein
VRRRYGGASAIGRRENGGRRESGTGGSENEIGRTGSAAAMPAWEPTARHLQEVCWWWKGTQCK